MDYVNGVLVFVLSVVLSAAVGAGSVLYCPYVQDVLNVKVVHAHANVGQVCDCEKCDCCDGCDGKK